MGSCNQPQQLSISALGLAELMAYDLTELRDMMASGSTGAAFQAKQLSYDVIMFSLQYILVRCGVREVERVNYVTLCDALCQVNADWLSEEFVEKIFHAASKVRMYESTSLVDLAASKVLEDATDMVELALSIYEYAEALKSKYIWREENNEREN